MKIPLLINGSLLVNPDFCKNDVPTPPGDAKIEYSGAGHPPPLDELTNQLTQLTQIHKGQRPSSDAEAAVLVHQTLKLTRRQAADSKFWHYVTVMKCSQYVVWRWRGSDQAPKERYLGGWERNGIGRLWWVAELTTNPALPDPYEPTRKASRHQEFALWCVDSFLSGNQATIQAMIAAAFDGKQKMDDLQVRELFKTIVALRATHAVDGLPPETIQQIVQIRAAALAQP